MYKAKGTQRIGRMEKHSYPPVIARSAATWQSRGFYPLLRVDLDVNFNNAIRFTRGKKIMKNDTNKDELHSFIEKQKASSPDFAEGFDEGYRNFRIGVMLKQARLNAGMSQVEVAQKLKTHKSAISRIENHAEDVKLSTLSSYAEALGK